MRTTTRVVPGDWQEGRRLRALALSEQGWKQVRIAEALGVTRGAVSQWLKAARAGGPAALLKKRRGHVPPKLSDAQRAQLPAVPRKGAEAHGFVGEVWTTPRVAEVIRREFGVRHHPAHVSRILKAIGWTVQKPVRRATQRDAAAITTWREEQHPALKAKPSKRGAPSSM